MSPFGLGLRYWREVLDTWERIIERWAVEMGEDVEPVLTGPELSGTDRVDAALSTSGADLAEDLATDLTSGPEIVMEQPRGLAAAVHVRRTLTRTTRLGLAGAMRAMCAPSGWQATTLNPDLPDARKFAILSDRFDKIALTDDPHVLHTELLGLAAVAAGWAQGIQRRADRDRKRMSRARRRARRVARRNRGDPT